MSKWEKLDYFFLYPDGDPDHSRNLLGSQSDQDPSDVFFFRKIKPVVFA